MAEGTEDKTPHDRADDVMEKNVIAQAARDNEIGNRSVRRARFVGGVLYSVEDLALMSEDEIANLDAVANNIGVAKSTPIGTVSDEELEAELERRRQKSQPKRPQLDRDGDGAEGGSLTKAQIASRLTELGVEFDATSKRDDLAKLLHEAENK